MKSVEEQKLHQEKLSCASSLCCGVEGIVFTCPDHDDVYIDLQECNRSEAVDRIQRDGDTEELEIFSSREELAKYVEMVLDSALLECPYCASYEERTGQC